MHSNPVIQQRLSALRTALEPLLDSRQTESALQLWQQKYAHQPTFSLQYFVRECCALLGVETLRAPLLQNLVKELNQQRLQTPERSSVASQSMAGPEAEAAVQVFQLLLRELTDSAGPLRGREIAAYVSAGIAKLALPRATARSLELWLAGSMPCIEASVPVSALTQLVNRAYVGLCEYCGPVKADQILHAAVQQCARAPAGQQFSPQRLL